MGTSSKLFSVLGTNLSSPLPQDVHVPRAVLTQLVSPQNPYHTVTPQPICSLVSIRRMSRPAGKEMALFPALCPGPPFVFSGTEYALLISGEAIKFSFSVSP